MSILEAAFSASSFHHHHPQVILVEGSTTSPHLSHPLDPLLTSLASSGDAISRAHGLLHSLKNLLIGVVKSIFGLAAAYMEDVLLGCIAADIGALIICMLASSTTTSNSSRFPSQYSGGSRGRAPTAPESLAVGTDSQLGTIREGHKAARLPCPADQIAFKPRVDRTELQDVHVLTKLAWDFSQKYKQELPSFPGVGGNNFPLGVFENKCLGTGSIWTKFLKAMKMEGYSSLSELLMNEDKFFFAFHGTRSLEAMASICCHGLDTSRRCGQAYGKGEYMDTDLSWANRYTSSWGEGNQGGGIIVLLVLRPTDSNRLFGEDRYDGLRVVNNPASSQEARRNFRSQLVKMGLTNRKAQTRFFSSNDCLPTYCLPVLAFPCHKSLVPTCLRCTGIADACLRTRHSAVSIRINMPKVEVADADQTNGFADMPAEDAARFLYGYQQACAMGNSKFNEGLWEYDRSRRTRKNIRTGQVETIRLLGADMKR